MSSQIAFNPVLTTNAAGSFNIESTGYIVGNAMADPATRYQLAGGVLATTETLPMWGGVALNELVGQSGYSSTAPAGALGTVVGRATVLGGAGVAGSITAFSVFDQNYSAINTPQSPVPLSGSGMPVHLYRLGSNARIGLQINSALTIPGQPINYPVSWDFVNSQITTYQAAYLANVTTAATWASTSGGQAIFTTTSAHGVGVGQYVVMSGFTPSGYNGTWLTVAGTTGSTIVVTMTVNPGAVSVEGQLNAGGGVLPVKLLDVNIGNSMTVAYNATTGFATWNRSGNVALVQI